MCIIAVTEHPQLLPKDVLEQCWNNNNHGAGISYVDRGQLKIVKELGSFKKWWHLFQKHRDRAIANESPMILHFRIASHGSISVNNIHPFFVNKNLVLAHNGVLPIKEDGKKSDTRTFVDQVLKKFPQGFEKNNAYTFLIEGWMGKNSKIVLMNSNKEIVVLNRQAWEEEEKYKTLFSNRSYTYTVTRYSSSSSFRSGAQTVGGSTSYPLVGTQTSIPTPTGETPTQTEKAMMKAIQECLWDTCHMCGTRVNLKDSVIYKVILSHEPNKTMLCEGCYNMINNGKNDVTIVDIESQGISIDFEEAAV